MTQRWHGFDVTDLLYGGVSVIAATQLHLSSGVALAMTVFAWFVLLVDWVEVRQLVERLPGARRDEALAAGLTLPILGVWYVLVALPPEQLALYFALFAVLFVLQAIRDVVLLGLAPLELLMQGYVTLVAVCLVLGAVADSFQQYGVALVMIGFLVFFVRKLFRWTATAINWYVPE